MNVIANKNNLRNITQIKNKIKLNTLDCLLAYESYLFLHFTLIKSCFPFTLFSLHTFNTIIHIVSSFKQFQLTLPCSVSFGFFSMSQEQIMHYQVEAAAAWSYYMRVRSMEEDQMERVVRMASQSAVVIFSVSSCCMCHAMKRLFCGMGVNPTVHELDQDPKGKDMERALMRLLGNGINTSSGVVPVVFIGGKLVGSMDRVLAFHISGALVPLLKQAGALWL